VKSEDKVELFDTSTSLDVDVDNLELTGYTGFLYVDVPSLWRASEKSIYETIFYSST
jgi:hypothetical protein